MGTKTLNEKTLLVYKNKYHDQTLDVDSATGLPLARHDSLTLNDKKMEGNQSEIYLNPSEVPDNLFDPYTNITAKEITAPFGKEGTNKN